MSPLAASTVHQIRNHSSGRKTFNWALWTASLAPLLPLPSATELLGMVQTQGQFSLILHCSLLLPISWNIRKGKKILKNLKPCFRVLEFRSTQWNQGASEVTKTKVEALALLTSSVSLAKGLNFLNLSYFICKSGTMRLMSARQQNRAFQHLSSWRNINLNNYPQRNIPSQELRKPSERLQYLGVAQK